MIPLSAIAIHRRNLICRDDLFKTFYCTEYLFFLIVFLISKENVFSPICSICWRHTLASLACNILWFLITDSPYGVCLIQLMTFISLSSPAWILDWGCCLISQQLFHGPSILPSSVPSPSSLLCHVFITVITRFACKQNNWSHGVCWEQALICIGPTVEPCGVPQWWLS